VDMSAANCLLSEDQFLCSICLDVFTDPLTTSCGHNFCKNCITTHWDINVPCQCPMCKKFLKEDLSFTSTLSSLRLLLSSNLKLNRKPKWK
uniref:RING-type domain-containing protein n=1 Tax=Seriola lalandi dorsalis TaxID=1841481 RepID=A0A3B4Y450_SERLL